MNPIAEHFAASIWGFQRSSSSHCVCHDIPQGAGSFVDEVSFREFEISGLCQATQDEFFADPEEEAL